MMEINFLNGGYINTPEKYKKVFKLVSDRVLESMFTEDCAGDLSVSIGDFTAETPSDKWPFSKR